LIAEIGDASFLIVLDFRKPAPRSQGCEVRAFLSSLDTMGVEKFQRVGIEERYRRRWAGGMADGGTGAAESVG
jgi:hypothetical protein